MGGGTCLPCPFYTQKTHKLKVTMFYIVSIDFIILYMCLLWAPMFHHKKGAKYYMSVYSMGQLSFN
jgi:hypothetical protein